MRERRCDFLIPRTPGASAETHNAVENFACEDIFERRSAQEGSAMAQMFRPPRRRKMCQDCLRIREMEAQQ